MKILLVPSLLVLFSTSLFPQTLSTLNSESGFNNTSEVNNVNNPCITPLEYQLLEKQTKDNIKILGLDKVARKNSYSTTLNWPIRAAAGFEDCDYYFIGAYVDQNTATGAIQDFDCGSNTYDGHHGTDISEWPFGFYKMDNNLVEVVAAAPGTIVQKADGNFDRNCSSNNLTANSIIIQHADGSEALYWHMKSNSVTSKIVGQTVVAGEYLGVVGSSGSASGPHLHFEVWSGNANTTYKDPFSGNCNLLNSNSWWNAQRPHTNSKVIKVSVNTTDIVLPGCPNTETPNESHSFAIPFQGAGLNAGYAKFYIFIRDDVAGLTADCKIKNPNGSVFNSWTYTSTANNKTYIKGYSKLLPTISGTYTFEATYNGSTCSTSFDITQAVGIASVSDAGQLILFPNPANGIINLSGRILESEKCKLTLSNCIGQVFMENNYLNISGKHEFILSVSEIPNGVYFLTCESGLTKIVKKLIVQNQ